MKMLCVIPSYWPAIKYGGAVTSVHGLNRALVRKAMSVTVYTTNIGLGYSTPFNQQVNVDGVTVYYFRYMHLGSVKGNAGWLFSAQMTTHLKNYIKTFDIVYIASVWNYPTAAAAFYCRRYGIPYIIAPIGTLYPYTMARNSWKKKPYYFLVTKRDIRGAAAIHYTTKDEQEKCEAIIKNSTDAIVIPNGIEMNEYKVLPAIESLRNRYPGLKDKKIILFIGRIDSKKGLDILIRAFASLSETRNDVHLLIAGPEEGGYGNKVRKWLAKENITEKTTFTGMLEGKSKLEVYAGSDIFVLPSYSENFGMTVIEAMACALPVIVSNQVGIYRDVSEADAGLVIDTDPEQLTQAMIKLLDDTVLCNKFRKNGRKLVAGKYIWDKSADMMVESLNKIL